MVSAGTRFEPNLLFKYNAHGATVTTGAGSNALPFRAV